MANRWLKSPKKIWGIPGIRLRGRHPFGKKSLLHLAGSNGLIYKDRKHDDYVCVLTKNTAAQWAAEEVSKYGCTPKPPRDGELLFFTCPRRGVAGVDFLHIAIKAIGLKLEFKEAVKASKAHMHILNSDFMRLVPLSPAALVNPKGGADAR